MPHGRIPPVALIAATDPSPGALAMFLLTYPREHLEALTDALVAALDARDGNPDLEEDDPSGDPIEEAGEATAERGLFASLPTYGEDQSRAPRNYRRLERDLQVAVHSGDRRREQELIWPR